MAIRLFHIGYEDVVLPIVPTDFALVAPAAGDVLSWNATTGAMQWVATAGAAHAILSAAHTDALAAGVTDGSLIIGNVTPAWSELVISVPAATFINHLAVANAELRPSWKALFDATVPTDITSGAAAAAGVAVVAARHDHTHGSPDAWIAARIVLRI